VGLVVVIPFRSRGKSRLPPDLRRPLSLAMLADVVDASLPLGDVRVVTSDVHGADTARRRAASVVADPGGGQGAAVAAALADAAGSCLVVNADLPLATTAALDRLAAVAPALVAAADGTTNALSLPCRASFEPLYGRGSARRFVERGFEPLVIPELEHDVDTCDGLHAVLRLGLPLGRQTTLVVNHHKVLSAAQ
jgi:2-phospho-L-lactate guanylyltransferase